SDKATLTLNAEEAGAVKILVKEGIVKVGDVVCKIDTSVVASENPKTKDSKKEKVPAEKATNKKPETTNDKQETANKKQETNYATGHPSPTAKKLMEEKNISADKIN